MAFSSEDKALMLHDDTHIDITIYANSPANESITIDNSTIYFEGMSLTEILSDEDDFKLGRCSASEFQIKIADYEQDFTDYTFRVVLSLSNTELNITNKQVNLGTYIVKSCEKTADKRFTNIIAYDKMCELDVDISDWYNNTLYPTDETTRTVSQIRTMLFSYLGVTYDTSVTFKFDSLSIGKNINPETLVARDFLQQLLEFNGLFGKYNNSTLEFISINTTANSETIDTYINCDYNNYSTELINQVIIKDQNNDTIASTSVSGDANAYIVSNNLFMFGLSATNLTTIATYLKGIVSKISYTPNSTTIRGGLCYPLGTKYNIQSESELFTSYVLKREINGIQNLTSTLSARGEQKRSEIDTSLTSYVETINNKTASIQKNIDGLSIDYKDYKDNTNAHFEMNDKKIDFVVSGESESEFSITDKAVEIVANEINLNGMVTFNGLSKDTQDAILEENTEEITDSVAHFKKTVYGDAVLVDMPDKEVNLFEITTASGSTNSGITATLTDDGGIHLEGRTTSTNAYFNIHFKGYDQLNVEKGKAYTLAFWGKSISQRIRGYYVKNKSSSTSTSFINTTSDYITFTLPDDDEITGVLYRWQCTTNNRYINETIYPMLVEGELPAPFIAYDKEEIDSSLYIHSVGKNILDIEKYLDNSLITYTKDDDDYITVVDTKCGYYTPYVFSNKDVEITLSAESVEDLTSGSRWRFDILDSNNLVVGSIGAEFGKSVTCNGCKLRINCASIGNGFKFKNIQIEFGDTQTEYSEFTDTTTVVDAITQIPTYDGITNIFETNFNTIDVIAPVNNAGKVTLQNYYNLNNDVLTIEDGVTKINGGNIATNSIKADSIDVDDLVVKRGNFTEEFRVDVRSDELYEYYQIIDQSGALIGYKSIPKNDEGSQIGSWIESKLYFYNGNIQMAAQKMLLNPNQKFELWCTMGDVLIRAPLGNISFEARSVSYSTDVDWTDLTLTSNFTINSTSTAPSYCKKGNVVQVCGDIKPAKTLTGSADAVTIATLPSGCRPHQRICTLCQGSGANKWLCIINTDGTITFSRYGVSSYVDATTSSWLSFNVTFLV